MIKIQKSYLENIKFNTIYPDDAVKNDLFPMYVNQHWNWESHLSDQKQIDELFWKFANEVAAVNDHWEIHQKDEENCPVCLRAQKRNEAMKLINEVLNKNREKDDKFKKS